MHNSPAEKKRTGEAHDRQRCKLRLFVHGSLPAPMRPASCVTGRKLESATRELLSWQVTQLKLLPILSKRGIPRFVQSGGHLRGLELTENASGPRFVYEVRHEGRAGTEHEKSIGLVHVGVPSSSSACLMPFSSDV
jgi:hypothetical protein